MKRELDYLVYCIENYAAAKGSAPSSTAALFERTGAADYVIDNFEALHLTGTQYMVEDLDTYMRETHLHS